MWRDNMAPGSKMLSSSQHLCHFHSSITPSLLNKDAQASRCALLYALIKIAHTCVSAFMRWLRMRVSVCVCVYVCVCVCVRARARARACVRTCVRACVCVCTYAYAYVHVTACVWSKRVHWDEIIWGMTKLNGRNMKESAAKEVG